MGKWYEWSTQCILVTGTWCTHPVHQQTCAGQWSRHHPRNTCLSSGSPCESPFRSRSSRWSGYNLCRQFVRVRPGQPWQRSCHRKVPITSPLKVYGNRLPAELVSRLSTIRACVHSLRFCPPTFGSTRQKWTTTSRADLIAMKKSFLLYWMAIKCNIWLLMFWLI